MNTKNRKQSATEFSKSPLGKLFLGGLPILGGVLTILVSLDIIPYVDLHPNRIAIFNDPHTWEVFAVGVLLTTLGLASIIPQEMKIIGKLNLWMLFIAFIAVMIGVIFKKFGAG